MTPQVNFETALRDPGGAFAEPQDVVTDTRLSFEEKLAILRQWEEDAVRLSVAESEGMVGGREAMLGRVERAIRAVQETRH